MSILKKVKVPIVSIPLLQLCDLRVSAHLCLHGPEPAVSCRHSSVTWVVGQHSGITFLAFRPVPNYTTCWQRHMCVNKLPRVVTWRWNGWESNPRPFDH